MRLCYTPNLRNELGTEFRKDFGNEFGKTMAETAS